MNEHWKAGWVRGRVTVVSINGRPHYRMAVINTRTGVVVATDDCCDLSKITALCHKVVGIAREAWFWSLKKGDLAA